MLRFQVQFGRKEGLDMWLVAAKAINGELAVSVVLEHVAHANPSNSDALVSNSPGTPF